MPHAPAPDAVAHSGTHRCAHDTSDPMSLKTAAVGVILMTFELRREALAGNPDLHAHPRQPMTHRAFALERLK